MKSKKLRVWWGKALLSLFIINYSLYIQAVEPPVFSELHGYKDAPFTLTITSATEGATIYYTTDCTTPSVENGTLYTEPLTIKNTATLRAVAIGPDGEVSTLTAATYIFTADVLRQSNNPKGYPAQWGQFKETSGTATADYEMDPEMTSNPATADSICRGLRSLPTMSIITEPGFLFSHEKDDSLGGIYIYTGSYSGGYGDGWLRAASVEYWPQDDSDEGFQVNCAIKIHGNASRLAEKTPKHSFRMKMKSDYGPKKLHYKLFGKGGGKKFNQIVIRAGFGNSWLHWLTSQQRQGMFTRDAWAKRMMKHMGHLSAGTRFANLYLNGMYWGMYNPTERIDGDFCELHLGGDAEEYDVVRVDDGRINTVDGTADDYLRLVDAVSDCSDYSTYQQLRGLTVKGDSLPDADVLLDTDNFIDFMLVNYYGGNGDWDHHNWVAVHRRGSQQGFSWLPWDSELVLQGVNDNILSTNNKQCPTYIFRTLINSSEAFKLNFVDRAYRALCEPFGSLTPDGAQSVWEDLTQEVDAAVWAESARWGDYRRDVHPYTSRGDLYTKLDYFDKQCNKMRTDYFPRRTDILLQQFKKMGWWLQFENAPVLRLDGKELDVENAVVESTQNITFRSSAPTYYTTDGSDPVTFSTTGVMRRNSKSKVFKGAINLTEDCTIKARSYSAEKGWSPLCERHFTVTIPDGIVPPSATIHDDRYYDLQGRPVANPQRGIYIHKGKKVFIK